MSMWDSNPNSIEELEEVSPQDLDWAIAADTAAEAAVAAVAADRYHHLQQQHHHHHHNQQQHSFAAAAAASNAGRRARQVAIAGDAECLVCRLAASGNNFGVATCESCKTFFRRNAKRDPAQIRCLHYNNCNVVKEYRRSCTACRLRKCFAVGMRKELILSEEKLRTRARPTFKKPRYRWCRLPANVDVERLLAALPGAGGVVIGNSAGGGGGVGGRIKVEPGTFDESATAPPADEVDDLLDEDEEEEEEEEEEEASPLPRSCSSTPRSEGFESSGAYRRLRRCAESYLAPYDARSGQSLAAKILYLEDGFACMDSPARKLIRMAPELPLFHQLDKPLLGRLIKAKIFGALQIVGALTYSSQRDAWLLPVERETATADAVGNSVVTEETALPAREAIFGTFMGLTQRQLLEPGVIGGGGGGGVPRALFSPADVERMYHSLTGFYRELDAMFKEHRGLAAIVLTAVYLLQDDSPLGLSEAERSLMRQIQWHYLRYLDDLAGLTEIDGRLAGYASKKALLLLMQIRWLDACHCDAAKVAQTHLLPPLMQELVAE